MSIKRKIALMQKKKKGKKLSSKFAEYETELSGDWTSINSLNTKENLDQHSFEVKGKEIHETETIHGKTNTYLFWIGNLEYRLLTGSKRFQLAWENDIETGDILKLYKDDEQGWLAEYAE